MTFLDIQYRLLDHLRKHIRNGDYTERGLARAVGLSQSHIHKVLRGARTLSFENLDWILRFFHLTLLDLFTERELAGQLERMQLAAQAMIEVPYLAGRIGPCGDWREGALSSQTRAVPCQYLGMSDRVVACQLAEDGDMIYSVQGYNLAVIAMDQVNILFSPTLLYVIRCGKDAVLRRIRLGPQHIYLVPDSESNSPLHWEAVPFEHVLGRVLWLGRMEDPLYLQPTSAAAGRSEFECSLASQESTVQRLLESGTRDGRRDQR